MQRPESVGRGLVLAAVATGFALRLWLAIGNYGNYDQTSFAIVAEIMERGGNLYKETIRYNYSPVWAYCLLVLKRIAVTFGLPLYATVKVFLTLADLGNTWLLGVIAERDRPGTGRLAMLAYALNPIAIALVGHHGQIEPLASLPVLGAIALSLRPLGGVGLACVWLLLTTGLLIKHIVFFVVLAVLVSVWRGVLRPLLLFGASLGVFGLSFLPFLPEGREGIYNNLLRYAAQGTNYGLSGFLPLPLAQVLFYAGMTAVVFLLRHRIRASAPEAASISAVGTLAFMTRMGEAYLLLGATFGALMRGPGYFIYSATGYIFLLVGVNNLQMLTMIEEPWGALFLSLVACFLLQLLAARQRSRAST